VCAVLNLCARQALDQLVRPFGDLVLLDQDCFRREEGWKELLQLIPESKIVKKLERKWTDDRSSDDKWTDLMDEIKASYPVKETRVSTIKFSIVYLSDVVVYCRHR
jgi:DNA primase small subunit